MSAEKIRREVLAYHGLPTLAVAALLVTFFLMFFATQNVLASGLIAVIPCGALLGRWVMAGKRVDRWGCPSCGKPYPKKIYWVYPPRSCSFCGAKW